jgi:hypothetical protein
MKLRRTKTKGKQMRLEIIEVEAQSMNHELPKMAPPNFGAPTQTTWKTHSIHRSPQETTEAEEEFTQREGIVDVDAIPSLQVKPVSSTLVKEEEKAPTKAMMDINSHDSAHGHEPSTIGNPLQPSKAKEVHRTNGGESDRTKYDRPRPQPMVGFAQ